MFPILKFDSNLFEFIGLVCQSLSRLFIIKVNHPTNQTTNSMMITVKQSVERLNVASLASARDIVDSKMRTGKMRQGFR